MLWLSTPQILQQVSCSFSKCTFLEILIFSRFGTEIRNPSDFDPGVLSFGLPLVEKLIYEMMRDVCVQLGMLEKNHPKGLISTSEGGQS